MNAKIKKGMDLAWEHKHLFVIHHNKPEESVPWHDHDRHELIIPITGGFEIRHESRSIVCSVGAMVFVSQCTFHEFSGNKSGERLIALIDPDLWADDPPEASGVMQLPANQLIRELLYQLMLSTSATDADIYSQALAAALRQCLRQPDYREDVDTLLSRISDKRLQKAVTLMIDHLSVELSMDDVAKRSGLSSRSLQRLLKSEANVSPRDLLIRLRVRKAIELLSSGNYNVTQTALEVGYSSLSQFIQSFKNVTGKLPSEFILPR